MLFQIVFICSFSYVLVLNNVYKGYGYLKNTQQKIKVEEYLESIIEKEENRDTNKIIQVYIKKNPRAINTLKIPVF